MKEKKSSEETGVTLTLYNIVLCYIIIIKYRMQSFYHPFIIIIFLNWLNHKIADIIHK